MTHPIFLFYIDDRTQHVSSLPPSGVTELASILKVSVRTVYRMLHDGRLRGFKSGGRWMVHSGDIETSHAMRRVYRKNANALWLSLRTRGQSPGSGTYLSKAAVRRMWLALKRHSGQGGCLVFDKEGKGGIWYSENPLPPAKAGDLWCHCPSSVLRLGTLSEWTVLVQERYEGMARGQGLADKPYLFLELDQQ